jgi:hypothetical protein
MFGAAGPMTPLAGWTVARPVFSRLEEVTGPATQPVTLAEIKAHLRITHGEEDAYLTALIPVATRMVEKYLSRRIVSQQVRAWFDMLPGTGNDVPGFGAGVQAVPIRYANVGMFRMITLPGQPVKSFEAFKYYTLDNVLQTYDAANYLVDYHDQDMPARVVLQYGAVWPVNLRVSQALALEYTLGYTTIPADISHAVKMALAAIFSNRGDAADMPLDIMRMPAIAALLAPYRVLRVGTL